MKKRHSLFLLIFVVSAVFVLAQQKGKGTYYNKKLEGSPTSDGGRYNPDSMTCAHRTYPLGTILKVRNPKNDRVVYVKVTDRGPFQRRLIIDLSYLAASMLDIVRFGIAPVEVTKVDSFPPKYKISVADSIMQFKADSLLRDTIPLMKK